MDNIDTIKLLNDIQELNSFITERQGDDVTCLIEVCIADCYVCVKVFDVVLWNNENDEREYDYDNDCHAQTIAEFCKEEFDKLAAKLVAMSFTDVIAADILHNDAMTDNMADEVTRMCHEYQSNMCDDTPIDFSGDNSKLKAWLTEA